MRYLRTKSRSSSTADAVGTAASEELYENVGTMGSSVHEEDDGWDTSEFESYDEAESVNSDDIRRKKSVSPEAKVSRTKRKRKTDQRSSISPEIQIPDVLNRLAAKLGSKAKKEELPEHDEDEVSTPNFTLDHVKHPPPELPPCPAGLTPLQDKRRHIVASIIESEKSYTTSLRRLVEHYEKPLDVGKQPVLDKSTIQLIFFKIREILHCHDMFHIELSECVRVWDDEQRIGRAFTASFSKSMVFNIYSAFVNNFSIAMETAKKLARSKPEFGNFLKKRLEEGGDRLSLFGLMVKPVQRFPQFIMFLQDLLKYTPADHPDRLSLQMALTDMENLTHRLNDTKRESDKLLEVKRFLQNVTGRHSIKTDTTRHMIRKDDLQHVTEQNGETLVKSRRLYMLSDLLVCVKLVPKETEAGIVEKFKYKWSVPIPEVDISDAASKTVNKTKGSNAKSLVPATHMDGLGELDVSENNPYRKEIEDMMHDLPMVQQISQVVGSLHMKYEGLSLELINAMIRSLQITIQHKAAVDRCILQISTPSKSGGRQGLTFQMHSPSHKHEWLLDLQNTKLALDLRNNPAWCIPENVSHFASQLPLFVKPMPIDITKEDKKLSRFLKSKRKKKSVLVCGIPVVMASADLPGTGTQHLWVCSSHGDKGHVTIVSASASHPHMVETFQASSSVILCAETAPGYAVGTETTNVFPHDSVWMATEDKKIQIRYVVEDNRDQPAASVTTNSLVWTMRYLEGRMYAGTNSGHLLIFYRDHNGVWQLDDYENIHLGVDPVRCMLAVNHLMWVANGQCVYSVHVNTLVEGRGVKQVVTQEQHTVGTFADGQIECMAHAGVGLIVSFRNKSIIRLLHMETFECITEINTSAVVTEMLDGKQVGGELEDELKNQHITYLMASRGLLWIGTNTGCVLTLPLPRLEGLPQIKGRPTLSYHAHIGPIRFLAAVQPGMVQLNPITPTGDGKVIVSGQAPSSVKVSVKDKCEAGDSVFTDGVVRSDQSSEPRAVTNLGGKQRSSCTSEMGRWSSSPDLSVDKTGERVENIRALYASLLRGMDEEIDMTEMPGNKQKWRPITFTSMAHKADALQTKISQKVAQTKLSQKVAKLSSSSAASGPPTPKSKYATLPLVMEDCPGYERTSGGDDEDCTQWDDSRDAREPSQTSSNTSQDSPVLAPRHASESAPTSQVHPQRQLSIGPTPPIFLHDNPYSKALVMVSGGEGHINWSKAKAVDSGYEDVCLMIWQCRLN